MYSIYDTPYDLRNILETLAFHKYFTDVFPSVITSKDSVELVLKWFAVHNECYYTQDGTEWTSSTDGIVRSSKGLELSILSVLNKYKKIYTYNPTL